MISLTLHGMWYSYLGEILQYVQDYGVSGTHHIILKLELANKKNKKTAIKKI